MDGGTTSAERDHGFSVSPQKFYDCIVPMSHRVTLFLRMDNFWQIFKPLWYELHTLARHFNHHLRHEIEI